MDAKKTPDPFIRRWVLLVLVCAALGIRGRAMLSMQDSLDKDPDHYREIARGVQDRHTFGLWQRGHVEPTAFRPPLYPLLLAPLGYLPEGHRVHGLLHVALGVATACIVWRLGLAWSLAPTASLAAAALVVVDPILVNQQAQVMTETLAAFLGAAALLALGGAGATPSILRAAIAGTLLGLGVLCRPTFAVWLIAVVVVWPFAVSGPRILPRAAAIILGAIVVISPWAIRNQIQFGRPIITTTHGGYTLLLGNNPDFYEWLRSGEWGSVWDSTRLRRAYKADIENSTRRSDRRDRELVNDRAAYEMALKHIVNQPAMFAYACLVRVGRLWGVLPHQLRRDESPSRRGLRWAVAVFYLFELALAAVGMWMLRRRWRRTPLVWGFLLLASFTAVHAVYWTDLRMRAPLVPVVVLLAVAGAWGLAAPQHNAKPVSQTG